VAANAVAGLVLESWAELDRVLDGLTHDDAVRQIDGSSSFAWTLAHLTNQLNTWINVRLLHAAPHPLFDDERWRMGGTGAADNWNEIRQAVGEVRAVARPYLESLDEAALSVQMPYAGTLPELVGRQVTVRYTLLRIAAHTYFHIGDIASVRSRRLQQQVGDYPGPLLACL
jgi:hypothetical protein